MIEVSKPSLSELEKEYLCRAYDSGRLSSGHYVHEFEKRFADFCDVKHCITTTSGTTALHLLGHALGIGPGDEVIVPNYTFVTSATWALHLGAEVAICGTDPYTKCISPGMLKAFITDKTKAIVGVHLYGHPFDASEVYDAIGDRGIMLIEDAAEAPGAFYKDRMVGSIGDAACFSFYGNKIISMGEGGCITTDDDELAEKCRFYRGVCLDPGKRYNHLDLGYNFRLTNLQAALGCAQLDRIDEILDRRKELHEAYDDLLGPTFCDPRVSMSHWVKVVYTRNRNQVARMLLEQGIETRPFFVPLRDMPIFKDSHSVYDINDESHKTGLILPLHTDLTVEDVRFISETFLKVKEIANG